MPSVDIMAEVQAASKALAPAVKHLTMALAKVRLAKATPLGAAADLLYDLRQTAKLVPNLSAPFDDVITPYIKALEDHFINQLKVGEASGVQGMHSRVQITDSPIPVVEDWAKFYAYLLKTKSVDLLNKAVNRAAVKERWENKKQVPGVGVFHAKNVSCTKLSGKGR
jgi:hypothetical protein